MVLPGNIISVMEILKNNGYESYVVGGCVRDAMMGIEPHDYDLTTSATPEEMLSAFEGYRIIETGLKHGTVTVVIEGENIEITTFRIDGEYTDNRHPDSVKFTTQLADDLSRRDFTVNAMAYNPDSGLVDLFGGMDDIKSRTIRCVGDADLRFNEDGLRILRALRFSSQLGFSIHPETSRSIFRNKGLLKNISKERIYSEFSRLLCGAVPDMVVSEYGDVLGEFIECKGEFGGLSRGSADKIIRYAYFLRECGDAGGQLKEIRAENETIRTVDALCRCLKGEYNDEISVKYLLKDYGEDFCLRLGELMTMCGRDGDYIIKTAVSLRGSCVSLKNLAVSGSDLKELGIKPGKVMGSVLNGMLDEVIYGRIVNEKQKLLDFAKTLLDNLSCP